MSGNDISQVAAFFRVDRAILGNAVVFHKTGVALFLSVIGLLFGTSEAQSQTRELDSLKQLLPITKTFDTSFIDLLNAIGNEYVAVNSDSSRHYGNWAARLAEQMDYPQGLASALNNLGRMYIQKSRYDSAFSAFDQSFQILKVHKDILLESEVHNGAGIANEETGNYGEAIKHYLESIRLKQQINDYGGIGKIHNNLGNAYHSLGAYDSATSYLMKALNNEHYLRSHGRGSSSLLVLGTVRFAVGNLEEAKELFEKALVLKTEQHEPVPVATLNAWIGYVHLTWGEVDSALSYLRLSLGQFEAIEHRKGAAALTARVAEAYMAQTRYDSAIYYLEKGIEDKAKIGDKQNVADYMINLAKCHYLQGDPGKAEVIANEAVNLAIEIDSKSESVRAYDFLHTLYSEQGMLTKAYHTLTKYQAYKDSVLNQQKLNEISRLETIYGVDQLEQDKSRLEKEKMAQDMVHSAELRRQTTIQYSILGGLLLVLLLAITYYRSYRRKQKANILLEGKNELITRQKEDLANQADELKAINHKLEELSNFKDGLTHMIAHDMKNPLHVIISLADGKIDKEHLKTIGQSGKEMLHLVTNMLDVQKFEEARMELGQVNVSIQKLVSEALLQTELLLVSKNIELDQTNISGQALFVDQEIMVRVLVNLLTNAVKYSPVGGSIVIEASPDGDHTKITLRDEGVGIEPEALPHIFDKFWQSNARKSGHSASTGIGLTFCKMAVEAHGGEIWVQSELQTGTTFHMSLPTGQMTGEVSPSVELKNDNYEFSASDLQVLNHHLGTLQQLKVHQISQINGIISQLDADGLDSSWKLQLKTAVFEGDQKRYEQLLSLIK